MKTVEAMINEQGHIRLAQPLRADSVRRALVTILDEPPREAQATTTLQIDALSDWLRPEEDTAWAHLQTTQRC